MKKSELLKRGAPYFLYALITVVYSLRFFEPGKMIFGHDIVLIGKYFESLTHEILRSGNFPFWNPYIFSGVSHFASLNVPCFYPTYFVYPLFGFPPHLFYLFEYVLCIFLSGSFMYLFANSIGLSRMGSFIAGVFFMFSGNITTLINAGHICNIQAMTCIPLIFYFFDKGIQKEKIVYFILAGCFLSVQCFSIGFQIMAYTVVMLFLYLLFKIVFDGKPFSLIMYFILTVILVPLISAVQFVPSYYYNKLSYRAAPTYEYFTSWSIHPTETINFLLPRFFGFIESTYWGHNPFELISPYFGILPILLAFVAVFFLIKDKRVSCFAILSIIVLLFSFGGYTPIARILYCLPVISSFRNPSRWLVFFTFSMVVLAGIGFDFLHKREGGKQFKAFKVALIVLALCFLGVWIWFSANETLITSKMQVWELIKNRFGYQNAPYVVNILYKMIVGDVLRLTVIFTSCVIVILLAFYRKINSRVLIGCLLVLFLADMWYIGLKSVKTVPIDQTDIREEETISFLKQDNSLYRVLPIDGFSSENWFVRAKIQSVKGYTISLKDYHDAMDNGLFNNINYLNLLNVKYLLTTRYLNHPVLKLVFDQNIKVYQNLAVLPRASLYNKVEIIKSVKDCYNKISVPDFNIREKLIINEDFEEKLDSAPLDGSEISIIRYHPNYITLNVNSPGNSVLFLSEIYYPEWKVLVDGKETKIYKANGLFRAIHLTKGQHYVKFYYSHKLFYIGLAISLLTTISLLIFVIRNLRTN